MVNFLYKTMAPLSLVLMMGLKSAHAVPVPDWFAGKAAECNDYISENLEYEKSQGNNLNFNGGFGEASGGFGVSIPGRLDKSRNPGDGKCCLFDRDGNIIPTKWKETQNDIGKKIRIRIGGSGFTHHGNDECGDWLREEMRTNPNAHPYVAGLYWCVGEETNCRMDWWKIDP